MEVELIEIRDFLAEHPPFDRLPEPVLDSLPKALSVRYLRRGSAFPPRDTGGRFLYILRTGAVELRGPGDVLRDKLSEGDLFAGACAAEAHDEQVQGLTVEDSLVYLLPCAELETLRRVHARFDEHFATSLGERLRLALSGMQEGQGRVNLMTVEARQLIGRAPVSIHPDASIRDAARRMTAERVSALLICEHGELVGIITDRDLRSRCIAEGLSYDDPVGRIMSDRLVKVRADAPAFEILMTMTRMNIHHLPVLDRERVAGMVTDTDLTRFQSANSVYLVGDIRKAASTEALGKVAAELPELQVQLVSGGANAHQLGQAMTSVIDALTCRLVELALERLGAAPVPFVWLAIASQARREQTVHTDQDNALLLDDGYQPDRDGAYFEELARFVCEGLDGCGIRFCPGAVMASNPDWRQPFAIWRGYFDGWINAPERRALMLASNFFDMRAVYGETRLYEELRHEILAQTRDNGIFLAHLAANALTQRPPLGFFRNLVLIHDGEHDNTLDLKRTGLIPIVDIARVHALSAARDELATLDRLRAAAEAGLLSGEGTEDLEDAFELIGTLRARHQVAQIKAGLAPDNYLAPDGLSRLERSHLKDAFAAISTVQGVLAQRYHTDRIF